MPSVPRAAFASSSEPCPLCNKDKSCALPLKISYEDYAYVLTAQEVLQHAVVHDQNCQTLHLNIVLYSCRR